jgi:hypothetical protein
MFARKAASYVTELDLVAVEETQLRVHQWPQPKQEALFEPGMPPQNAGDLERRDVRGGIGRGDDQERSAQGRMSKSAVGQGESFAGTWGPPDVRHVVVEAGLKCGALAYVEDQIEAAR